MPFATCPNCKSRFHINVRDDLGNWEQRFPVAQDDIRYMQCFGCWKELKEYELVEVWDIPQNDRGIISKGDTGTIVMIHNPNVFEIECVNDDGSTKWLRTISREYLRFVPRGAHSQMHSLDD